MGWNFSGNNTKYCSKIRCRIVTTITVKSRWVGGNAYILMPIFSADDFAFPVAL